MVIDRRQVICDNSIAMRDSSSEARKSLDCLAANANHDPEAEARADCHTSSGGAAWRRLSNVPSFGRLLMAAPAAIENSPKRDRSGLRSVDL